MIEQECIDELADYVGLKPHVAAITERAMRGEIAFEPALRERVALLKGLPVSVVDEVIAKHITLTPGARTLVKTMRAHGTHTCLVTGGFTLFSQRIAAMIGFDESRANTLAIGRTASSPARSSSRSSAATASSRRCRRCTARLGLDPEETMAIGDGANDIAMIEAAGLGVAYPRQAEGRGSRRRAHRSRRPHRAALPARLPPRRISSPRDSGIPGKKKGRPSRPFRHLRPAAALLQRQRDEPQFAVGARHQQQRRLACRPS